MMWIFFGILAKYVSKTVLSVLVDLVFFWFHFQLCFSIGFFL